MTLIELMVALAIGSFLMIGAITVFMQSRTTFRINESVARLQENARFAIDILEPDVRMAQYFGLMTRPVRIQGRARPTDPAAFAIANDCGTNWSVNVASSVDGTNNGYAWLCAAFGTAQPTSDTLAIRRVSEDPVAVPEGATLYVQTARVQESQLFVGPAIPAGFVPGTSQTHQLVVSGYYVSGNSTLDTPGNNLPSLRVKSLAGGTGGLRIIDQEVLPGVEDMQIQFGIDTDLVDDPGRGSIDRYVNPGDPILDPASPLFMPNVEVLSVRVWLRIRAERAETGFTDTTNYIYADQNVGPFNDAIRRILVSKTIYLRNARPPR
jgi:type II secretory pathway pseudopilin PulG